MKKHSDFLIYTILLLGLISCQRHLLLPLKNGKETTSKNQRYTDVNNFIYPTNDWNVRAVENCRIIIVIKTEPDMLSLCAQGKYTICYCNLKSCAFKKGDSVKRGDILGELQDSLLAVGIKDKNGHYLTNPDFKKH